LRKICSLKISICKCDTAGVPRLSMAQLGSTRAVLDLHFAFYIHTLSRRKLAETRAVSPVLLMICKCRRKAQTDRRRARRSERLGWITDDEEVAEAKGVDRGALITVNPLERIICLIRNAGIYHIALFEMGLPPRKMFCIILV